MIEPLGIELAEQPVATSSEMAEVRRRRLDPLIAADESVERGKDAARAAPPAPAT